MNRNNSITITCRSEINGETIEKSYTMSEFYFYASNFNEAEQIIKNLFNNIKEEIANKETKLLPFGEPFEKGLV